MTCTQVPFRWSCEKLLHRNQYISRRVSKIPPTVVTGLNLNFHVYQFGVKPPYLDRPPELIQMVPRCHFHGLYMEQVSMTAAKGRVKSH